MVKRSARFIEVVACDDTRVVNQILDPGMDRRAQHNDARNVDRGDCLYRSQSGCARTEARDGDLSHLLQLAIIGLLLPLSMSALRRSRLVTAKAQHRHEGLLRNLDIADDL